MKKPLVLGILIAFAQLASAQVGLDWYQSLGQPTIRDQVTGFAVDDSGNTYLTGSYWSQLWRGVTYKVDRFGNLMWARSYSGVWDTTCYGISIAVDRMGSVFTSYIEVGDHGLRQRWHVIKYDPSGSALWNFDPLFYGRDNVTKGAGLVALDSVGNAYVAHNLMEEDGDGRVMVSKLSSDGPQWIQVWFASTNPGFHAVDFKVDKQGNSYVFARGSRQSCETCPVGFAVLKILPTGSFGWLMYLDQTVAKMASGVMAVDEAGNVYVGINTGLNSDNRSLIVKFNSEGTPQWQAHGQSGSIFNCLVADGSGGVYALGQLDFGVNPHSVCKYNSLGSIVWTNSEIPSPEYGALDSVGSLVVANKARTVGKIDPTGTMAWRFVCPTPGWLDVTGLGFDDSGYVYIGAAGEDFLVMRLSPYGVYRPAANEKWISGEIDTIRWKDPGWAAKNITCVLNEGRPDEEVLPVAENITADSTFAWEIPNTLLSYKSRIIVANAADPSQTIHSDVFRLKPYRLTTLTADSTYEPYRVEADRWGFGNSEAEMWPASYWASEFDYSGTDPFTGKQYSQTVWHGVFANSTGDVFPDWVSFVKAFGVAACYYNVETGDYSPMAVKRWWDISWRWRGSCFGIAASNALAYSERAPFEYYFPTFPPFGQPFEVQSDTSVIKVVTALHALQFGNPSLANIELGKKKTPNETLNELKAMLRVDEVPIRTFCFQNNGGDGGHAVLAHWLEKEEGDNPYYRVHVWDNTFPSVLDASIRIDTTGNGGNGTWWATHGWAGWGGASYLFLEVPSERYFLGATLPKTSMSGSRPLGKSAFVTVDSVLEVLGFKEADIAIQDASGNVSGHVDGRILSNIPGSSALRVLDGAETPPYGYLLKNGSYVVTLDSAGAESMGLTLSTGNRLLSYERSDAMGHQSDRIVFDGGMRLVNPDPESKSVRLVTNTVEVSQEKLFALGGLVLGQADSMNVDNTDPNNLDFRSYGQAKSYDLEVNLVSAEGTRRFVAPSLPIGANSGHTIVPDWSDINNSPVTIFVDEGNDGSFEDTLRIENTASDVGQKGMQGIPTDYALFQNYPNPFNPVTTIRYALPQKSVVSLVVFNLVGQAVATLCQGEQEAGAHEVTFDGTHLSSGVYIYRLMAGEFVATRKLVLLR